MRIYNITEINQLSLNGHVGMSNETSQQWKVSTRENGHIVVDVLERPKPQQHAEAELYGLLDEVNKVIDRVEFGFDMSDKLTVYNSHEIAERYLVCRENLKERYGSDQSIMQLLEIVGQSVNDFGQEMRSSLVYYTLWSWFGGGKSFHLIPLSILHANHYLDAMIVRKKKEKLEDGTIHLMESGTGELDDVSGFQQVFAKEILPLTSGASFHYSYSVDTEFFCAEDYQPFFDKAVTFVKEQASEDYVYTNRIEFKLVEDKV